MDFYDIINAEITRPGRYLGGEVNSVRKSWKDIPVKFALAYPDMYEVGMSYLGLRIIYHMINEMPEVLCERVFAPWGDLEERLRSARYPLFSLENRRPLNDFDMVGFSLAYELTYTNVLNMLDLGGIPVRSRDRSEKDPIVVAGGTCAYNPEPLSPFVDAFFMGDAEEALPEVLRSYRSLRQAGSSREQILKELASTGYIYVPGYYSFSDREKTVRVPAEGSDAPSTIERTVVKDLDNAYYPEKQIVPYVRTVHDRIAIELMRGCPNRCRFCQASAVNRPLRIRTPERVRDICMKTYRNTGYERVALLSLSSVNYPELPSLVSGLNSDFEGKGVGITIPSLRVDEAFYDMPAMLASIRKGGLTFAPETASEDIRRTIGKDIDTDVLKKAAVEAYRHGWKKLKLYFMVGFPGEPEKEAQHILDLAKEISVLRKKVSRGAAEIKVSVNPFIPKPHTPFQWLGMKERSVLEDIKRMLLGPTPRKISVDFHNIDRSFLEAALSRGDHRLSEVIYSAWRAGARLDAWSEYFSFDIWAKAFRDHGLDPEDLAVRKYGPGDKLPWAHINAATGSVPLDEEYRASGLCV